jgi:DhnA family fructose-bisphosphate aldolase class Ia
MALGKSLRLRRLFANGRALIAPLDHGVEGPVAQVRALARAGADGVAVSPGILEQVVDELAGLAVILRLNGSSLRTPQLIGVQGALEMGAEAIALRVDAHNAHDLEILGRVTDEARRLGMPVIADIVGENLLTAVNIAAEYGADIIQTHPAGDAAALRHLVRTAGRPVLVAPGRHANAAALLDVVSQCLDAGVQGIVIEPCGEPMLAGIHALIHQGVPMKEALAMTQR